MGQGQATDPSSEGASTATDRTTVDLDTAELGGAAGLSADRITTSTRSREDLGERLRGWLTGVLTEGSDVRVTDVVSPESNGMSSETVLFTAHWTGGDARVDLDCVARIEPELDKLPVFPAYDLELQYRVIDLVGAETDVPVPRMLWYEPDPVVVGGPFFVMTRVSGQVPPDVLPYTFGENWTFDATPEDRARMQRSAVAALAGIHGLTPATHDLAFLEYDLPGDGALERHLAWWERYLDWVVGDDRSPLLDECFAWLRANLPTDHGDPRLSWGDARIGNMLFEDFEVAAVLDWEMAAIAPAEVDLGWMAYLHQFFQDLTTDLGAPGLPDFMQPDDLADLYEELTGRHPADLSWFIAYAAMRHGVIMRRVTERAVLFGEAVRPPDIDDMIIHRRTLHEMLDGTYWERTRRR